LFSLYFESGQKLHQIAASLKISSVSTFPSLLSHASKLISQHFTPIQFDTEALVGRQNRTHDSQQTINTSDRIMGIIALVLRAFLVSLSSASI